MGVGSEVMGEHLAGAVAEKRWNRTSMVFTESLQPLQKLLWEPPQWSRWARPERCREQSRGCRCVCRWNRECLPGFLTEPGGRVEAASRRGYGQSRQGLDVSPAHGGLGHPLSGELAGIAWIGADGSCQVSGVWVVPRSQLGKTALGRGCAEERPQQ